MSGFDLAELLPFYLDETDEQIAGLNDAAAEAGAGRPTDADALREAFRMVHSIKGSSMVMGFDPVKDLTHHLESLFDQLRRRSGPSTGRRSTSASAASTPSATTTATSAPAARARSTSSALTGAGLRQIARRAPPRPAEPPTPSRRSAPGREPARPVPSRVGPRGTDRA